MTIALGNRDTIAEAAGPTTAFVIVPGVVKVAEIMLVGVTLEVTPDATTGIMSVFGLILDVLGN